MPEKPSMVRSGYGTMTEPTSTRKGFIMDLGGGLFIPVPGIIAILICLAVIVIGTSLKR